MVAGALLQHLLEKYDEIVVLEEFIYVYCLIIAVFRVILNYLTLDQVRLMVEVKTVQEGVLLQSTS